MREVTSIKDKADALFEKKKYRKALRWYNQIPAEQAGEEILLKMAECYLRTRQIDDCEMYSRKVLETNPENLAAHILLCKVYMYHKAVDNIEKEVATILSINDNEAFAYTALGYINYCRHNIPGAMADLEKSLVLGPKEYATYLLLGQAYLLINQKKKAIELLKIAFRLNPTLDVFLKVGFITVSAYPYWAAVGILLVLLLYLITGVEEVMLISTFWFLLYGILAISARKYKVAAFQLFLMMLNLCTLMWVLGQ
jgi:tetratricopeptide (TPR) repeat protein